MSLYPVVNPFSIILNQNGGGLNGGKIYIGLPNQDPETNPKSVYWDAEGTDLASQPLVTIGGYIWNAGTPAQVFVDGSYSIRVRDRFDTQIFYEPDAVAPLQSYIASLASSAGAGLVGFSQTSTYAYGTVGVKLQERVSVKDSPWGATGNGTTDDAAAINACIAANPGKEIYFPAGRYRINSTITVGSGVSILGVRNRSVLILGTQNMVGIQIGDGSEITRGLLGYTAISCIDFNPLEGVTAFTSGACIDLKYHYGVQIHRCTFYGADTIDRKLYTAIRSERGQDFEVLMCQFFKMNGYGVHCFGTGLVAGRDIQGRFDYLTFSQCGLDCVFWGAYTEGHTANFNIAAGNDGAWLRINSQIFNFFVTQPDIEGTATGKGIVFEAGSNLQVVGGWFGGASPAIETLAPADSLTVIGVVFNNPIVLAGPVATFDGCDLSSPSIGSGTGLSLAATAVDVNWSGGKIRQWATGVNVTGTPGGFNFSGVTFRSNTADFTGGTWSPGTARAGKVAGSVTDQAYQKTAASSVSVQPTLASVQIAGATAVNAITVPPYGQELTVQAGAGGITLNHGTLLLKGAVNATMPEFTLLTLQSDGANLIEKSRGF